jgi:hypothetical protein
VCDWRKVALLVPLLASNRDGEVLATAHAIRRLLESGNCDLHDLAKIVAQGPSERPKAKDDFHPRQWYYDDPSEIIEVADYLLSACAQLNPWERNFLESIRNQAERKYGFELSEKQRAKLEQILKRHENNGRRRNAS